MEAYMQTASDLLPARLLRYAGPPVVVKDFRGVQIDDARLSKVLSVDAPLLTLYEGTSMARDPHGKPRNIGLSGRTSPTGGCWAGIPMVVSRS
jgi:hypothetical protein